MKSRSLAIVEPFFTGSHQHWAEGYARFSSHRVQLLTLPGRHWKWRMHGGAVTLAQEWLTQRQAPDLLLATDMLDLTTFLALIRGAGSPPPSALYFHENQLTYPWSPEDADPELQRDRHYAFINITSALAADAVFFNSQYHRRVFLEALPAFLSRFPDYPLQGTQEAIAKKATVLPLGMDLKALDGGGKHGAFPEPGPPIVLWNHRWEYDKDPATFFELLRQLQQEGIAFRLVVLGEGYRRQPAIFDKAKEWFSAELLHWGFAASREEYSRWLWQSDVLPVTSRQDFFGGSVVEAMYCGCLPLLPDRLAFPEHLPQGKSCQKLLYASKRELLDKLRACLKGDWPLRIPELAHFVSRYDWRNLGADYDRMLWKLTEAQESSGGSSLE